MLELGSSKGVAGRPGPVVQLSAGLGGWAQWVLGAAQEGEPAECWACSKCNQPFSSFRRL